MSAPMNQSDARTEIPIILKVLTKTILKESLRSIRQAAIYSIMTIGHIIFTPFILPSLLIIRIKFQFVCNCIINKMNDEIIPTDIIPKTRSTSPLAFHLNARTKVTIDDIRVRLVPYQFTPE